MTHLTEYERSDIDKLYRTFTSKFVMIYTTNNTFCGRLVMVHNGFLIIETNFDNPEVAEPMYIMKAQVVGFKEWIH